MEKMIVNGGNQSTVTIAKPWGWEDILCVMRDLALKRVGLKPGQRLSVQIHVWKFEVYYVISGGARLELGRSGEVVHVLSTGDVVALPPGVPHSLIAGDEGVVIIETSTPEITDIIRITDPYGRQANPEFDYRRYWSVLYGPGGRPDHGRPAPRDEAPVTSTRHRVRSERAQRHRRGRTISWARHQKDKLRQPEPNDAATNRVKH